MAALVATTCPAGPGAAGKRCTTRRLAVVIAWDDGLVETVAPTGGR
jgi:hypothetical protein